MRATATVFALLLIAQLAAAQEHLDPKEHTFGPWGIAPPLSPHPEHPTDGIHRIYCQGFGVGPNAYIFLGNCSCMAGSKVGADGKWSNWQIISGAAYDTRGGGKYINRGKYVFVFEGWGVVKVADAEFATGGVGRFRQVVGRYGIAGHGLHFHFPIFTTGRDSTTAVTIGGFEYVGGTHAGATRTQLVCYAPVRGDGRFGDWQEGPAFPHIVLDPTGVAVEDTVYVLGGGRSTDPGGENHDEIRMTEVRDGKLTPWVTLGRRLPYRARGIVTFHRGGYIYAIGGVGKDVPGGRAFVEAQRARVLPNKDLGPWEKLPPPPGEVGHMGWGWVGPYLMVIERVPSNKNDEVPRVFYCRVMKSAPAAAGGGGGLGLRRIFAKKTDESGEQPPDEAKEEKPKPSSGLSDDVLEGDPRKNWKQLCTITNNTKDSFSAGFPQVNTKVIRLRITHASAAEGPDCARLAEVLLFGSGGILLPSEVQASSTQEGYNLATLYDGDQGFSDGEKKKGWASAVAEPGKHQWLLFTFRKPEGINQLQIVTAKEEAKRVRGVVVEIPRK